VTFDEHKLPCLYLLWPGDRLSVPPRVEIPEGYGARPYVDGDDDALRQLIGSEGWGMSDEEWQDYKDRILPHGLFLIQRADTGSLAATAGAVHNPNPGRYYFLFGGELGYLLVHPEHRGMRLGQAVSALVVGRFLSAGYESIRVCVQGFRLAAIKTYLNVGFVPFLHSEEVALRWRRICEQIGRPFEPGAWPKDRSLLTKAEREG
jgi:mycothiol synthase